MAIETPVPQEPQIGNKIGGRDPDQGIYGPTLSDLVVNDSTHLPSRLHRFLVGTSRNPFMRGIAGALTLGGIAEISHMMNVQALAQENSNQEVVVDESAIETPLYPDEQSLLNSFANSTEASAETLRQFSIAVQRYSVEAESLDVSRCEPSPLVFRVGLDEEIQISNPDEEGHDIYLAGELRFRVAAGYTITLAGLAGLFKHGPGIYGYTCDTPYGIPSGIFHVVPPINTP